MNVRWRENGLGIEGKDLVRFHFGIQLPGSAWNASILQPFMAAHDISLSQAARMQTSKMVITASGAPVNQTKSTKLVKVSNLFGPNLGGSHQQI